MARRRRSTISLVDYSRQESMDNATDNILDNLHIIIGCGGVGYWLGLLLAMMGATRFVLFDEDKIQPSNLNRLPVPQTWLGKNKAICLRSSMRMIRPDVHALVIKKFITADTLSLLDQINEKLHIRGERTHIWDTTDDARIQQKIFEHTHNRRGFTYNKIGYEGFKVGSYRDYNIWCDEENYQRGYRTTMANAITSVFASCVGLFNQLLRLERPDDCVVDIVKLIIEGGNDGKKKEEEEEGRTEARPFHIRTEARPLQQATGIRPEG